MPWGDVLVFNPGLIAAVWLTCQAAAARFAEELESHLQRLEADPTAALPGRGSEPLSCVRLCALRCAENPKPRASCAAGTVSFFLFDDQQSIIPIAR